mmetsp:Transcript_32468/g.30952  ORF Transcript_32468/g.30952 Transcript_32468/m.30952 type:complete len:436 (-) Transcript_32468:130-1437(-)
MSATVQVDRQHKSSSKRDDKKRKERSSHHKSQEKPVSNANMWNKDNSDFICLPQFHNSLPNAPSGPYLKNIELLHRYQDFSQYKTSSLEKNYIWQPHFGPDLGLRLDLVDQEALFIPEFIKNEDNIDAAEMRLLKGEVTEGRRGKVGGEKPWWLRSTTYLENNLYVSVVKTKKDIKRQRVNTETMTGIEAYVSSFDTVEANLERLAKESREKLNVEVEWSIPFLPTEDFNDYFAVARYDEDPDISLDRRKLDREDKGKDISNEQNSVKASHSILANIRQSIIKGENPNKALNSFTTSLVLPSGDNETTAESVENGNDAEKSSSHVEEADVTTGIDATSEMETASTIIPSNSSSVVYKWVKDYTMDVNSKQDDSYILTVDIPGLSNSLNSSSSASSSQQSLGSLSYRPIRSKLELKKDTTGHPHEAIITRSLSSTK